MRERLRLLAYFSIFWISFQVIIRAVFLLYNHDFASQLTASEIFRVFLYGLKMDISFSGYFIMLTSLCLTVSVFTQSRWLYLTLNAVSIFSLFVSSVIVMVDLELYRHWGFRVDITPLFYLSGAESEAAGSVDILTTIKLLLILTALFTAALFAYSVWPARQLKQLGPASRKSALVFLVISGLMVLVIRGSLTVAPMNTGFVYFHKTKTFANHAAINAVWNFFKSMEGGGKIDYPSDFFNKDLSIKYFDSLYTQNDSTAHLFTEEKPNIVLFILESFTADIIEPLGGIKGLTPNLTQLCSEGILFDNFYSSGDRTDKGVISILSGYPAQPKTSIIKYPAKAQKLPFLNQYIHDLGYATSFVYGGDVDFANFRSYLTNSRFDHITSDEDFPEEDESKWGVHDHIVFERAFAECDTAKGPFFKVVLSLSSHEPFDVPMMPPYIKGQDEESLFLNSCHYTDKSIGEFITKAKASPWWKNTVVIFVADHGHRHPGNKELKAKERFRIPLLMAGGAIKKDTVIHSFAGHTDIANTLLAQIGKTQNAFKYSRNILSAQPGSFAAYFFNNGYGFVAPGKYIVYDNSGKQFLNKEGATDKDLDISNAYQQILYLDYNSK